MTEASFQSLFNKNIVLLLLINLVVKPIYILFIEAQVQNVVGPNEYGVYFGLINFALLFNIILDPGIHNYNSKFVSQNRDKVFGHFASVLGLKLLLILSFLVIISLSGYIIQYPKSYFIALWGVGIILTLNSLNLFLRSHFSALGQYRKEVLLSGLDKILIILCLGYFLYVENQMTIRLFILVQVLILVLVTTILLILLSKTFKLSVTFSIKKSLELLKKTAPYALVLLLMTIYTRIDGVMLERLLEDDAHSAGIYAAGFRLMDAANMIGILFAVLLLPMFATAMKENRDLNPLFQSASILLLLLSSFVSLISWFYANEIMHFIYTDANNTYVKVFKYLMLAFWAMANSSILGCLFLASGKLKKINYLFLIGIIVNLALNIYYIPKLLSFGAVIATVITQFLVFFGMFALARKMFAIKYLEKKLGLSVLAIFLTFILSYYLSQNSSLNWLIEIIIIAFFAVLISFFLGLLRSPLSHYQEKK